MKPRFAIRFADDGLALLHRSRRGWVEVGETAFDTPDLDQAMAWLRSSALGLSSDGIETWLVLPNSQVLYTDVTVDGATDAAQRAAIAAALEGRTPYDVADLVYDFILTGTVAQVAVVARETLEEAEGFAVQHGLNPIGFTAVPGAGVFDAAPFFGMTAAAATVIPGKVVRREARLVAVEVAAPDPAKDPAPQPVPEPAPENRTEDRTEDRPELAPEPEPILEPVADLPHAPEAALAEGPAPEAPAIEAVAGDAVEADLAAPEPEPEPAASLPAAPDALPLQAVLAFDPPAAPVASAAIPEVEEAPIALDVPDEYEAPRFALRAGDGLAVTSPGTAADDDDDATPVPSSIAASLSFASRRTVEASIARGDTAKSARSVGVATRGQPGLTAPKDSPAPTVAKSAPSAPLAKPETARARPPALPVTERRTSARVTAKQSPAGAAAAAKPTEFNPKPRPPVSGKPRYLGLILTGVLLLFLAVAAALSNYLIAGLGWGDATPAVETVADTPATGTAPEDQAAPVAADPTGPKVAAPPVTAPQTAASDAAPADTAAPETATPVTATPETATAAATPPPTETPPTEPPQATTALDPAPAAPASAAVDPTPEPSATPPSVAATEAANVASVPQAPEAIILSSTDQAPAASDAGALPDSQAQGDSPPAAVAAPPPFGTVYQFDDKGLIVPTPEGIRTPEGVLLVAGPPPLQPPPRPEGLVPEGVVPQTVAATAPVPEAFPADPALAGARPRARPADLIPPATNSGALIPVNASATGVLASLPAAQNTGLRPAARPQAVLDAGLQAQQDQLAAASLAASALSDPNRSILAIAVSRRPAPRPADMARAVEAAVAAAARLPAPEPQPEPAPDPQPEANPDIAPEMLAEAEADAPEAAMPDVPTRASVAKQATVANVLNMSKLSLIGIYGTPSNRHAMVRQANGRYVKVSIGDRIDGGRVAAITGSELRYQKGGRMVVLEMPQG